MGVVGRLVRLIFLSRSDAVNDSVTPGEGGHRVERMISRPSEPHGVLLHHEVLRQEAALTVIVQLVVRSHGGYRGLKQKRKLYLFYTSSEVTL